MLVEYLIGRIGLENLIGRRIAFRNEPVRRWHVQPPFPHHAAHVVFHEQVVRPGPVAATGWVGHVKDFSATGKLGDITPAVQGAGHQFHGRLPRRRDALIPP